jgi:hypothetical protein
MHTHSHNNGVAHMTCCVAYICASMLKEATRIEETPGRRLVEDAAADIQRREGGSGGAGRHEGRSRNWRRCQEGARN